MDITPGLTNHRSQTDPRTKGPIWLFTDVEYCKIMLCANFFIYFL